MYPQRAYRFSKSLRRSTSVLSWKVLKDLFSFQLSKWTKQNCVAGNMFLASFGLGGPATASYSDLCRIDTGLVPLYRHSSETKIKRSLRTSSRGPNSSCSSPLHATLNRALLHLHATCVIR